MKKLALSFLALSLLGGVAQAQIVGGQAVVCNQTFQVSQAAVALTKVISGVAGKTINICGFTIAAGAATGTFSLSYGTGTNCGTGTTTVIPIISLAINGNVTDHVPFAHIGIPAVNASAVPIDVCVVTTGTGPTSIILYYFQ